MRLLPHFCWLGLVITGVSAVQHFKELNSLTDLELLGTVKDGKALKHLLLGYGTTDCVKDLRNLGFPAHFSDLGEMFETGEIMLDRHDELGRLFNVTHCNEFVYIPSGHSIAEYDVVEAHDEVQLKNWLFEHLHADVVIENDLPFDVEVLWEGSPRDVSLLTISSGKMETIHTYVSHHLVVRRSSNKKRLLRMQVEGEKTYLMSQYVSSEVTRVCVDEELCHDMNDAIIQVNNKEMEIWRGRERTNDARVLRNEEQPLTKPLFTELGFKKIKQPPALRKLTIDFYNQNKHKATPENWGTTDYHTNFFDSPTSMVTLPDNLKEQIFELIRPILEEWIGGETPLKPTSCYGIRNYHHGSWLREHVDTGSTHIVSAIMQIDQQVNEDWKLTFIDHHGDRHFFKLEPGDMVLYESATCIHGRPAPFNGTYFANTFVHFMPTAWT